jgi:3-oxoacyl-[acyl-carrier protein] reductase
MRFEGKVAVVTGSSRGIGRSIALELGLNGASVVVNFNQNEEAAEEVSEAIQSAGSQHSI